ncbi:MAG: VOC family protein [Pirellulales bacterium]
MFELAIPVLHVADAAAAEAFYRDALGFEVLFAYRPDPESANPCYLGLRRDAARMHVSSFSGDAVSGGVVYLLVGDVDALHRELCARGVPIDLPPTDQTWGNRELYVKDPDGNTLRFVTQRGG